MQITKRRNLSIMGIAAVSMFGLAACGGGSDAGSEATPSSMAEETSMASESPSMEASMSPSADAMMDPAANLVGPGCEGYAEQVPEGDGSVEGMSLLPVADAAAANPILKQLTAAVSGGINPDVDLVDTLNGGEFTVFAPVDDAFAALPAETVEGLKTDTEGLNSILTYHVVPGKIQPSELEGTTQTTVQTADLEVTGSGDDLMVNDAKVICGGVQTANAVVYLVDTVLTPPAG
ncbi:fasciclin [Arthrobacter pityocampae]|uniref:Fasciclin n=1 Tax=Arthrobacter pityocampae TaxID=547334 RepID=A0A2S5J1G1_9MICC|nr:fasciclin domain-containing protein [Arthrobacter pityocampae]PPB50637.1 fasciclin [Arthrobacter pityocampae]